MKKKKEEDDVRRKEQAAALAVRKVIQKVRVATPETYDKLRTDLEEAQATHLEALGSQAEKVSQEAEQTLQQAQKRIDEINEKRAEDERRRIEDEKRTKEESEKVERLLAAMTEDVSKAEERVKEAQDAGKTASELGPDGNMPEALIGAAETAEKAIETVREVLEQTSKSLVDRQEEMGENDASRRVKRDVGELHGKVASGRRALDKLASSLKASREKASRKAAALKKEQERKDQFDKHDNDKDGQLNRMEIMAFSKSVHEFELPEEVLNNIMRILEPVSLDKFLSLHQKVAIAKSEAQARVERKEQELRRQALEAQRQAVQKVVDEADEFLDAAEETLNRTEGKARPILGSRDSRDRDSRDSSGLSATEIREVAAAADELVKQAGNELTQALGKLKKVEDDCQPTPELHDIERREVPRLKQRHARSQVRCEKILTAVKAAQEKAVRKAYAELESQRAECVKAMRAFMNSKGKNGEQFFADIDGGAALKEGKFVELLKSLPDMTFEDGEAEKMFRHIAGEEEEEISKEKFLEHIRLYYKCVKSTVLSEDVSIRSKTIRRLEVGEVLEALEGPSREEGANVQRVRCLCVQDEATGWATIAGNQGTAFLEPGGNIYSCVKETVLTDGLSVQDSKTIRRIGKGELIEVLEFTKKSDSLDIKRVKGKAKLDGATGWITTCGNQGTTYLEPC